MKIESLTFKIKNTTYRLSGISLTENNILYSVKNIQTGDFQVWSKVKLEQIFKKYNAKFV